MGVNSLPKTVSRQRRDCDLNPGRSAPESSTLTTRLPSHPFLRRGRVKAVLIRMVATAPPLHALCDEHDNSAQTTQTLARVAVAAVDR